MSISLHLAYGGRENKRHKNEMKQRSLEGNARGHLFERQGQRDTLKKEYDTIDKDTRSRLEEDRKALGLGANDQLGGNTLSSQAQAATRGARFFNRSRLNALEGELGDDKTEWQSTTQANTGGVPGSTANATMPLIQAESPAVGAVPLDELPQADIDPVTGKPRQRAIQSALGAQGV